MLDYTNEIMGFFCFSFSLVLSACDSLRFHCGKTSVRSSLARKVPDD